MNKVRYKALFELRLKKNKYEFDSQIYSIKNKLLVFSSIIIAATFVSPNINGVYEINMGIIKGNLKTPELLFIFLGVVCLYYLMWLILHARKLVVNNYTNLNHAFMWQLASLYAKENFKELAESVGGFYGEPVFKGRGGGGGTWTANAEITNHALRNYLDLKKSLLEGNEFRTTENTIGIEMSYEFTPEKEDYLFFKMHRDFCWTSRLDEWFVTLFPIIYAVVAEFILIYHIICRL